MDLNAPLGTKPPPRRRRSGPLVSAVIAVLLLGGLGVYLLKADPHGGEPFAVATIPPPPPPAPASSTPSAADPTPTGSIGAPKSPQADTVRMENGVKVVSPASVDRAPTRDTGPLVIDVSKALDGAARRTASAEGLPRTNAAPGSRAPAMKPRVAIFISGMGLNPSATRTAIETMPAAVSLAFVATAGASLTASVDAAKAQGHEILLQLPMQNAGDPAAGPHTLRADESAPEIARDMAWLMGQVQGYVGVTNLLGAPVTGKQDAMTTILRSVGQRGMFYLDDGTSRRSVAPSVAATLGIPAVQADVVLDATADPTIVRANLNRLATIARAKGTAIGMASGFPDHLPLIARFAADLDAQGLILVPVSVIASGGASLATTR